MVHDSGLTVRTHTAVYSKSLQALSSVRQVNVEESRIKYGFAFKEGENKDI